MDSDDFKEIPGFKRYLATKDGRIYSKSRKRYMKPQRSKYNCGVAITSDKGKRKNVILEYIIATTFIPNPNQYMIINHKDGDKDNNSADNLQWLSEKKHNVEGNTILEYPDYIITRDGKIYTKIYSRYLSAHLKEVYFYLRLFKEANGKRKRVYKSIHRLVALAFIPNPNNLPIVNHKDGNTVNNAVENLEWVTHVRSMQHASETGLLNPRTRPVIKYSKTGKEIERFNSLKEAGEKTGIDSRAISKVCLGHEKTAGGFIWEYITPNKIKDDPAEVWLTIDNHENHEVSSKGRIFSKKYKRCFVLPSDSDSIIVDDINKCDRVVIVFEGDAPKSKYVRVCIDKEFYYLHVLVAKAFLGDSPPHFKRATVNHKNGDKYNNSINNLEWMEFDDNVKHAHETGLNKTSKPCVQYSLKGKKIRDYPSVAAAAKKMEVSHASILGACNKNPSVNTIKGFIWRFSGDDLTAKEIKNLKTAKTTVNQYSLNGEFIKTWGSIKEASTILCISGSSVSQCCRGINKTAGRYKWEYN